MLVDYHFHPNLSKYNWLAKRKCKKIWQAFSNKELAVVVSTEHVYKNPTRAYQLLQAARPSDATTLLFPGIEALTKEGVDLIIFSNDQEIFQHQKLMVPKQLNQMEMIQYVKTHPKLVGSLAHPALLGHSGSERQLGKTHTIAAIKALGGAEIHNACFHGMLTFMKWFKLERLLVVMRQPLLRVVDLPTDYYQLSELTLVTGGSDAHVLSEIGSGMVVTDAPLNNRDAVFQVIRNNKNTEFVMNPVVVHPYLALYKSYSVIREALIKALRLYEGRLYQNDDMFTNFYSEAEKETVQEIEKRRVRWLKPILNLLTYFEVTPKLLNVISVTAIIASAVIVYSNERWGVICFIVYLLSNSLSGPLARYQAVESESGALAKIILYKLALLVSVFIAMTFNWIDNWVGALYLVSYILMLLLTIALNKIGQPVRLVVRSINVILTAMLLRITLGVDWLLTPLAIGFSVYMVMLDVYMTVRLLHATSKKSSPQSKT